MTKHEELYHKIAEDIPGITKSKMFGALCLKTANGKAGVMFWKDDMVFKLEGEEQQAALQLKGAAVFEPAEGRPMGGWIQIPNKHSSKWADLARQSMEYVSTLKK